jgi:protein SCO1/2
MKKLNFSLNFLPSLLIIVSTLGAAPLQAAPPAGVRWEQRLDKSLPLDVNLNDENGQLRELKTYFGAMPVVLVFSYFQCPNLCTLVLNGLVDALKGIPDVLGKDYQVVTISIDPREKPPLALAKKRSYLARLGTSESRLGGGEPALALSYGG